MLKKILLGVFLIGLLGGAYALYPYNTYLNKGLPPGPISMASITSIDAVLDSEDHEFYYMCVDPDNQGYHVFAETLSEHNRNARRYHRWLDGIEQKN